MFEDALKCDQRIRQVLWGDEAASGCFVKEAEEVLALVMSCDQLATQTYSDFADKLMDLGKGKYIKDSTYVAAF
ncbi:hypothetical protein Gpo141_00012621 [Globisporangium polare]